MKFLSSGEYMSYRMFFTLFVVMKLILQAVQAAPVSCREMGIGLQVLGSGGPETIDQ